MMPTSFRCLIFTIIFTLSQVFSWAQAPSYLLKVRGGEFVPEANASRFQAESEYLSKTSFGGHHYVVLQFEQLPSFEKRQSLRAEGIELMDYIPELSYTARIRPTMQATDFLRAGVRSITYLKPENKTVPALLNGMAPSQDRKSVV